MKCTGVIHTAAGITEALRRFDRGQSEVGCAVLDMISSGLRDTPPVMATCSGMESEEIDAFISLAAHQVIVDLAGLVLPSIHMPLAGFNRAEILMAERSHRLSYEISSPGPLTFVRWLITDPGRLLTGNVDQLGRPVTLERTTALVARSGTACRGSAGFTEVHVAVKRRSSRGGVR